MAFRIAILIFMTGFAASIGQILVIRELLVIFYGNELSTGIILACWLLCTAAGSGITGRICRKRPLGFGSLLASFAVFCAALPATVVWVRASRALWSIPPGELLSPGMMLVIAFCATAPFCFLSGSLFALAWEFLRKEPFDRQASTAPVPPPVYLAESLGSGAGGLIFYFILLPLYPSFAASLALAFVSIAAAIAVGARPEYRWKAVCLPLLVLVFAASGTLFGYSGGLDCETRRLQWGKTFFQSRDTPYHNLSFLSDAGQFSLFSNGLWLFSSPDPQTAEPATHVPMLENEHPGRVLLIGDYSPELVGEVLKHPDVTEVDCVQPDAGLTAFTDSVLSRSETKTGSDPRVHTRHIDPRRFMENAQSRYDVILLGAGEPVNAEMNRFYTVEFFSRIKSVLNTGGLFSFGIPAAPDIIGPREAVLLQSLHATLAEVFGTVLVLPGETARFIASNDGAGITVDPKVLIERMRRRGLDLKYLRSFYFFDLMNPLRLTYMESIVGGGPPARINRDFEPVCYLYGLGLLSAQFHPWAARPLSFISGGAALPVFSGLGAALLIFALFLRKKDGIGPAVLFNVGFGGAVLIVVEVVLLLIYQIMDGSFYKQMALIISLFMAGLAVGSTFFRKAEAPDPVRGSPAAPAYAAEKGARRLFAVQVGLAVYLGALYILFSFLRGPLDSLGRGPLLLLFSVLGFLAGIFGGAQFGAATAAGGNKRGAAVYASDLIGASTGAFAGSLFFVPTLGLPRTLLVLGVGCLIASISLLRRR